MVKDSLFAPNTFYNPRKSQEEAEGLRQSRNAEFMYTTQETEEALDALENAIGVLGDAGKGKNASGGWEARVICQLIKMLCN